VATGTMSAVSALQMIQTETMTKQMASQYTFCHRIVMEGFHNLDLLIKHNYEDHIKENAMARAHDTHGRTRKTYTIL
jgi:hypothetical protein